MIIESFIPPSESTYKIELLNDNFILATKIDQRLNLKNAIELYCSVKFSGQELHFYMHQDEGKDPNTIIVQHLQAR